MNFMKFLNFMNFGKPQTPVYNAGVMNLTSVGYTQSTVGGSLVQKSCIDDFGRVHEWR